MKNELVEILVEEPSMKNFLTGILPLILPDGYQLNGNCFIREHQGKNDLQKSIPVKVRAFKQYTKPVKVIIIHDQDSADCKELKNKLIKLVTANAGVPFLIRIACRELESWYLGDMDALETVYPEFKADKHRNWAKFRNPETCDASIELKQLIPNFQKGYTSKEIVKYIDLEKNNSVSFKQLIWGIKKFLN